MNFPIFRDDYEFRLEEIYRYLKTFRRHTVYLSLPRNPYYQDYVSAESIHEFPNDGLAIRLLWRANAPERFHPEHTSISTMLSRHKSKEFSLLGFKISEYSNQFRPHLETPDEETRRLFEEVVMQNRRPRPYTKAQYEEAEYQCRVHTHIPEVFFQSLTNNIQKIVDFEQYYTEWQKRPKDHC